jgi:HPt (histidine-containing phosphotransfer) domain-containing protein
MPPAEEKPDTPAGCDGFDLDTALRHMRGDHGLLKIVVQTALEEIPEVMENIRRAIDQRDAETLHREAHRLKGSIRYFGDTPAYETAYRLEILGKEGKIEEAGDVFPTLDEAMARMRPVLLHYVECGSSPPRPSAARNQSSDPTQ